MIWRNLSRLARRSSRAGRAGYRPNRMVVDDALPSSSSTSTMGRGSGALTVAPLLGFTGLGFLGGDFFGRKKGFQEGAEAERQKSEAVQVTEAVLDSTVGKLTGGAVVLGSGALAWLGIKKLRAKKVPDLGVRARG